MQNLFGAMPDEEKFFLYAMMGLIVVLILCVAYLFSALAKLKRRYRAMMHGNETGANFETMLLSYIDETRSVAAEHRALKEKDKQLENLLQRALTRIGVVRFSAFEDMGGDLSYAVAMLDAYDNGVVFSSIFGREDSRGYAKPIEHGQSKYALSEEEQEAIHKAMNSAKNF